MIVQERIFTPEKISQLKGYIALLSGLIKKELQTKYAGSYLGILWSILYPGILFALYYFVCKIIFRLELKDLSYSYAEYLFCGLWPWVIFSDIISRCSRLFVDNSSLIKKTTFPLDFLVFSSVGTGIVELCMGLVGFVIYMSFTGGTDYIANILFRLPVLFATLLYLILIACGIGIFVSTISIFFQDFQQIVLVVLNIWFYGTPIIYSANMVPDNFRLIFDCNPFFYVVDGIRWFFLGRREAILKVWGAFLLFGVCIFVVSYKMYRGLRKDFASFV